MRRDGLRRWPFAVLAYAFVGIALVGVVVPGLPTFPFLLLAAWAASRGSEGLDRWLHEHPRFGPSLRSWREEGAISYRSKGLAIGLLVLSWTILYWRVGNLGLMIGLAVLFSAVSIFLLTRPEPGSTGRAGGTDGEGDDRTG